MKVKQVFSIALILFFLAACAPKAVSTPTAAPAGVTTEPTATLNPMIDWTAGRHGLSYADISFVDLYPQGVKPVQGWNAMGMDDRGRVYFGFTSTRTDGREDFAVFRFDPSTGEKKFLGTFLDIVAAAGNSQEGESIPKGHTRMIFADGKMYMASQSFHDLKQEIDSLPTYRGSHLFAYDTNNDTWQDLSAGLPGGVVTEHEGIISLNIIRSEHLLVGLMHPSSDIVLFDYTTNQVVKVVPGIPWQLGNPLSRETIVTPTGHIYTYRGTEDPADRLEKFTVWIYDIQTDQMTDTGVEMSNGFWNNQTETLDGSTIYINTVNGGLYKFDVASETFTDLGRELPATDPRTISYNYSLTLSPDEKYLYYAIAWINNGSGNGELFAYEIATGTITYVQQLPPGMYTSGDARDNENIYFIHFGSSNDQWNGTCRLMVLHIPPTP